MTTQELRAAYRKASTKAEQGNPEAIEEAWRLYRLNPDVCFDVDDERANDERMNGAIR
jgi:hypothetical protein